MGVTNIVPEVQVNKYNVDVPVAVPRAVPREIVQVSHVAKPYEVPVPRAVPVPAPYKVHPVQEIVETPHIHHATYETHSSQAVVTAHATPVHAVSHVPVAVAAPAACLSYHHHHNQVPVAEALKASCGLPPSGIVDLPQIQNQPKTCSLFTFKPVSVQKAHFP